MKHVAPVLLLSCLAWAGCQKMSTGDATTDRRSKPGGESGGTLAITDCILQKSDAETIPIFPSTNAWNQDISTAAVDPNSVKILQAYGTTGIHADFGGGIFDGAPIGIPFITVCSTQTKIPIVFRANDVDGNFGDESDPGPYPIPLTAPIEGNGEGDSHVIAVDKDNHKLYELYNASISASGDHWEASSGAIFDLNSNALRPDGWTSADAAGLPIFAGLVRYDEVASGTIDHALRFTLGKSHMQAKHIFPARHHVNGTGGTLSLPMGGRIRLKASVDISHFSPRVQTIALAMKKYGLILADVGSNMFVSGAPDDRWDNDELRQLGNLKAANFEVIKP